MKIVFEVTQKDIDESIPHFGKCPIERAINRVGYECSIGLTIAHFYPYEMKSKWDAYFRQVNLPNDVAEFVHNFDLQKNPKPGKFEIVVPEGIIKHESKD